VDSILVPGELSLSLLLFLSFTRRKQTQGMGSNTNNTNNSNTLDSDSKEIIRIFKVFGKINEVKYLQTDLDMFCIGRLDNQTTTQSKTSVISCSENPFWVKLILFLSFF
jgi:hypothetical protein